VTRIFNKTLEFSSYSYTLIGLHVFPIFRIVNLTETDKLQNVPNAFLVSPLANWHLLDRVRCVEHKISFQAAFEIQKLYAGGKTKPIGSNKKGIGLKQLQQFLTRRKLYILY
jgi:hypothetical protein